jgi:hypothetical protein
MRRPWLLALVLGAFLARVVLPAFHFHDEGGRGGECHHHHDAEPDSTGPAAAAAEPLCAVCEILATKVPGLAPGPPLDVAPARPVSVARVHAVFEAPRAAVFSLVGAPRGPPASSSPA